MRLGFSRRDVVVGATVAALAGPAWASERIARISFGLSYNLPWTTAAVNGDAEGAVLISTGLSRIFLSSELVGRSGAVRTKREISDTALGRRETDLFFARRVTLGSALEIDDAHLASLPAGYADPDFAGAVGGIFSKVVAGFDFEKRLLTIARRSHFDTRGYEEARLLGGPPERTTSLSEFSTYGAVESLVLEENGSFDPRPAITATIDGREVRLLLDTGFSGSVLLYGDAPGEAAPDSQVWLFGAGPAAKLARARELSFAGVTVPAPVIEYVQRDVRAHQSGLGVDGVIGMELLRRFHIILDMSDEAVWMKPNKAFGQPIRYNKAGMNLTKQGSDVLVANITPHAPAWQAGLQPGDRLVNWAGAASLRALQASLSGDPGARVELLVQRDQRAATLAVELQDLV